MEYYIAEGKTCPPWRISIFITKHISFRKLTCLPQAGFHFYHEAYIISILKDIISQLSGDYGILYRRRHISIYITKFISFQYRRRHISIYIAKHISTQY